MGDQRQLFRFRLPWLSAAATARSAAEPQPPPAAQTQVPSQPTATIPFQRPPFRLPGITPIQTIPTQAQAPPEKTEPQPAAPLRATTEPKATSQPVTPARLTNQIRASSVPPSPSRRTTETQVTSQPVSPSRGTIQPEATSQARPPSHASIQARDASMPLSPSRNAPQPQSATQAVSKQQSPSRLASQPAGQTSSQPSSPSHRATQVQTLSPPKRSAMATQVGSQPPSSNQSLSSASQEPTFKPFGVPVKPSEASAQLKEVVPITAATTETPSVPLKPKEREERKKVANERRKVTTKGSTHEEPEQRTVTTKVLAAATKAGTKTRELLGAALETGKRHQEKQEDIERKKTWTASSTDEKQIKTVSSTYPKDQMALNNFHQKHVTSNWEKVPLHKEIREDISKFVHKLATGQPKLPTDEKSISVLTLTGENKGASFYSGSESAKKNGLVHIHQGYNINPDDSLDATTDGEGSSRGTKPKDSTTKENQATRAYVNSNTQSINNSIVFESSLSERNSGVQLDFLHNLAESTKSSAKAEPLESCKVEFNITQAEKLTYEPTVRRRCPRGLFAESSDSDPDNP